MKERLYFSPDTIAFLYILSKHKAKYLIVGGEAVIFYGHARLTGDVDIFYELTEKNVTRLYSALYEFWDGDIPGIRKETELMQPGAIFQFGVPPNRIDLLNSIEKVSFTTAWENRKGVEINLENKQFKIYFIGLNELIKNKEAIGRNKDKDDLIYLEAVLKKRK